MITPDIYQDYSDYLSSIIEHENIINDISSTALDTSEFLEAPIRDPSVISVKHELSNTINNNNKSFVDQYYVVDNVITELQLKTAETYGDLNEFLEDNSIIVGYYFAQSSNRLGFTINDNNVEYVILDADSIYVVNGDVNIKFNITNDSTTATVVVYGTSFVVEVSNDQFVWDSGGAGEHTFTGIGESIQRSVGLATFYVTWMGYSSFLFSVTISESVAKIYVATDGSDDNGGSLLFPVKTLEKAKDLAVNVETTDEINIIIREGTYELDSTLILTTENSGTLDNPIIYKAYAGETVIISGGKALNPTWVDYGDGIYYTDTTDTFRQLYVDGNRANKASSPWTLNLKWEPVVPGASLPSSVNRMTGRLIIAKSDIAGYSSVIGAELNVKRKFMVDTLHIVAVEDDVNALDADPNDYVALRFTDSETALLKPFYSRAYPNAGYRMTNLLEFLTDENEWCLDTDAGRLYYKPPAGESIDELNFSIPNLEKVIEIKGDDPDNPVQYINFENLIFEKNRWDVPNSGYICGQGGSVSTSTVSYGTENYQPPGAITLENANNVEVRGCTIRNTGASGISLTAHCSYINIEHCLIQYTAAHGVVGTDFADYPFRLRPDEFVPLSFITVHNNKVLNTGVEYCCYAIYMCFCSDSDVTNNTIAYCPYSGIAVGWLPYEHYIDKVHRLNISNNDIYDFLLVCGEGGGIYSYVSQPVDSIMSNNYIHRMHSPDDCTKPPGQNIGFFGVLHDGDHSAGWTCDNNLIDVIPTVEGDVSGPYPSIRVITKWEGTWEGTFINDWSNTYTDPDGHGDIIAAAGADW